MPVNYQWTKDVIKMNKLYDEFIYYYKKGLNKECLIVIEKISSIIKNKKENEGISNNRTGK